MSKLDEAKETLNTFRVLLSIFVAIAGTLGGTLVNNARSETFDVYFYLGCGLIFVFSVAIIFLLKKIKSVTSDIGEM